MPVIVISGLPGAGSTTLSKLIAQKLSLDYFSPGRVFKDIAHGKVEQQYYYQNLKELFDKKGIIIPKLKASNESEAALNLWNTELGKSKELHNILDKLQLELAQKGNIVIDGKLSLFMIKNADFKIWLKASQEARIKRSAQRDNIEFEIAREIIPQREQKELEEWTRIYDFDYREQEKIADLVINTSNLSPDEIADKIINASKKL